MAGAAATSTSKSHLLSDRHFDAILSQFETKSAQCKNVSLLDIVELWKATPQVQSQHTAAAYPELANLVDLCPLLQAEPDSGTDSLLAYPHVCDGSQDRLPCAARTNDVDFGSLAMFTAACHSQQSCRSWWLQQESQHGVCSCTPLPNLQPLPQQHSHIHCSFWLPSLRQMLWLLIPLGRAHTSHSCLSVLCFSVQ